MSRTEEDTSPTPPHSLEKDQEKIPSQSLSKRKAWENVSASSRSLSSSPRQKSVSIAAGLEPKNLWDDSGSSEKKTKWELKSDIKKIIDTLGEEKSKEMSSSDTSDVSLLEVEHISKRKQKRYKRRTIEIREPKEYIEHAPAGQPKHDDKSLPRTSKDSADHHKIKNPNTVKKEESKEVSHREVEIKRVGFPESSSLSILQSCIDDPSIMCHCRKKPSHSAPDLEQLSNNNLRGYETAPNLSSACAKVKSQMEKTPDVNSSFESMLLKEPVEVCTCRENKNSIVCMNHVYHCNEICNQQVKHPTVKYQPIQNSPISIPPNYRGYGQMSKHVPRKNKIKTGKKNFSRLRNLIIKRKTITVNKNNLFHDPFYGKQGIQQNVAAPWLSNIGNCYHNCGHMESQNDGNCYCTRNAAYPTNFTHQELYASKIAAETDNHHMKKKKFNLFPALKKDARNPEKLSPPEENGLFRNDFSRNSDFKKSLNDFIRQNHNFKNGKIGRQIRTRLSAGADDGENYTVTHPHPERIEVYYFDHGCAGYFRTTDPSPPLATDMLVERIDSSVSRFWASCFGVLHVITAFIIAFILQFLRFLLYSILRPLLVGVIQITSDYFFKPFLAISFNSILQPIFIFVYNIASSLKDICEVIAQAVGYFLQEIANVCHAIRLVDIKNNTRNGPFSVPPSTRSQQIEI